MRMHGALLKAHGRAGSQHDRCPAGRERPRVLLILPLLLLLAACGATPTATPLPALPTATAPPPPPASATPAAPAATAAATTAATPGGVPTSVPAYFHTPDYHLIAGQVHRQVSCWVVTYVSPAVQVAADKYGNQVSLIFGPAWNDSALTPGAWVIVQGYPDPQNEQTRSGSCGVTGYQVASLTLNPNAPK